MNPTAFNDWSASVTSLAAAIVWQSTLFAALAAGACWLLKRSAPALRYWCWQIVALKLLLMPWWIVAIPLPGLFAETSAEVSPHIAAATANGAQTPDAAIDALAPLPAEAAEAAGQKTPRLLDPLGRLAWRSWLVVAWLAGIAWQVGRLVIERNRLRRVLNRAAPAADPHLLAEIAAVAARLGLSRLPRVVLIEDQAAPFVCGLFRPVLALPRCLAAELDAAQLRDVLLHELGHLKRRDLWWGWLPALARTIYFFHPAAHWASFRIRLERELACDQLAMALGGRSAGEYAEVLFQVISRASMPAALAANSLEGLSTFWRRRLTMLVSASQSSPQLPHATRLAIASAALAACLLPTLRHAPAQAQPDTDQSQTPAPKKAAVSKESDSPASDSRVSVHPVTIEGVARNEKGEAIAQAKVYLLSTLYEHSRRVAETTTDGNGQYAFRETPLPVARPERNAGGTVHGSFEVLGVAEGYAFAWRPRKVFIVAPRPERDNLEPGSDSPQRFWLNDPIELDLKFLAAASISGRIADEQGRPVVGAKVELRRCERIHDEIAQGVVSSPDIYELTALNQPEDVPAAVKIRKTDSEGRFEFTGLPPECLFRFDVKHPDYARMDVWAATTSDQLPKLAGRIPILTGALQLTFQAVRDAKVRVVFEDTEEPAPGIYVGAYRDGLSASRSSDEQGEVAFRLPQGDYTVELLPTTGTPYLVTNPNEKLTIGAESANKPAVFKLRRACVLDVTVVDADTGLPIPDVDLWIDGRQNPDEFGTDIVRRDFYFRSWHPPVAEVERPVSDKDGKLRALVEPGLRRLGAVRDKRPAGYTPDLGGQLLDCMAGATLTVEFKLHKAAGQRPGQ